MKLSLLNFRDSRARRRGTSRVDERPPALDPGIVDAELARAASLRAQGRTTESLRLLFDVVARSPDSRDARQSLVEHLDGVALATVGENEHAVLLALCGRDDVSMRRLTPALTALFANAAGFARLERCAADGDDPLAEPDAGVGALLDDPLFLAALPRMYLISVRLGRILTSLRRHILLRLAAASNLLDRVAKFPTDLACAIAGQCFFSGYPFLVADDEQERLEALRETVQRALARPRIDSRTIEPPLAAIAMYEYLNEIAGSERLLDARMRWCPALRRVLQQQLEEPRREREISRRIPAMSAIRGDTSLVVREQYEQHPYPVWTSLEDVRPDTVDALCARLRPGRSSRLPARPFRILVAGCGTGEHPLQVAKKYPDCEVVAIDLSLSSLSYAARMTERFGLSNVTYLHGDLLEVGRLDRRFAIIECCGVLHHLRDPLQGWRMLLDSLDADGLMRIGLYSERARRHVGVAAARDFARTKGYPPTADGIRNCRRAIMDLPDQHPAKIVLACADFFSLNGCRDLIMNVQESEFTLPQVADCLQRLGMRVAGMQVSKETAQRFQQMFPDSTSTIDLGAWDRFEDQYPATFMGMYLFWCERK